MIPFRFGPPEQRLFAAYHRPQDNRPAREAVLLCNPLGQEAVRVHRFYRVLADRLARAGTGVLRFDYHGTGDSDGDDQAGHLALWEQNTLQAHQELVDRSDCPHVSWVGARLGATVAARAASALKAPLTRLLLWEPIVDGPAYLAQLARDHVASIRRHQPGLRADARPAGEALGFGMGPTLLQQIDACRPDTETWAPRANQIVVLGNEPLAVRIETPVQHRPLSVPFDWTSEEAMNTALVPPEALRTLLALLEGGVR